MKSATAVTYELDDISAAVGELLEQLEGKFVPAKESVGILHAHPHMEVGALSSALSAKLGFPIIGGTTAGAATLANDGHHELAMVLHVMTADDCVFAAAISESMAEEPRKRIVGTYEAALAKLKEKDPQASPKMIFCVTSIVQSYSSDDSLAALSEVCGGIPIFGYVAADDFEFSAQQVFLDGKSGGDLLALLLIAGNVEPIFEVKNLAGSQPISKRQVTKAHDNVICEIDGRPAYEYLKEFPFIDDETKVLWNYQFFVEMQNDSENDGTLVSRALNAFDKETGEISCFANVPENSCIGLLFCDDSDVKASAERAMRELMEKIEASEKSGRQYSAVFVASCSLRNVFLVDQKNAEGNLIREILPSSLAVSGLYAFGEIAPTSVKNGRAVNRFHNATMTICAL